MGALNVFTYTINGSSLTVVASDNVQRISIICSSGDISVWGSAKFQNISPVPIFLAAGQGITISSKNDSTPIDGFTIDASIGIADIVLSYQ